MKKLSSDIILFLAIVVGVALFVQGTPVSLADDDSCSGVNYFSCVTGGRSGSVGAGPGGSGGYFVNDPTPGGMCSCNSCLCVTGRDIVGETGVKTEIDIGLPPTAVTKNKSGVGGAPTDRIVSVIKIVVNSASTCDSACRAARNQAEWDKFYTGFYDIPVFRNVAGNNNAGGGAGTGATANASCVGMGCNVTNASLTTIKPSVDVFYQGIYPIRSLTETSGSGTKTISQQEFDAKYGSYIQR